MKTPELRPKSEIFVKNARVHNLKGIDVRIPRNALTVITGLSGSGKSSLAFDTIYAEGQRRYVESLSAYARQFLDQMQKPDVEYIEGLSPAISIEQRNAGANPRSTVGTITEVYDYLRLLYASIGIPHCHRCGRQISSQSAQEIVEQVMILGESARVTLLAPLVEGRKGEYHSVFDDARKAGFVRARVDGVIRELSEKIELNKKLKHTIEVVVDRLTLRADNKKRLTDSVEAGLRTGGGVIRVAAELPGAGGDKAPVNEQIFSEHHACAHCGVSFEKIQPRMFSFNSPYGACPMCDGLGNKQEIDVRLVIPDPSKTLRQGAIVPWKRGGKSYMIYLRRQLRRLAERKGFSLDAPFESLSAAQKKLVLYGEPGADGGWSGGFEGVVPNLERRFKETDSEWMKNEINKCMSEQPCTACSGRRLKPESLAVRVAGKNIHEVCEMPVDEAVTFFGGLKLSEEEMHISRQILKEIRERLKFMLDVGLGYLTLSRTSGTLSGGEAQRIRLATQIGAGLMGVLYVLDEPSIGLHQRDNQKLLATLESLKNLGNTLIVVEHDEETMRVSDHLVDLGPGAGAHGGRVVYSGPPAEIVKCAESVTGKYLSGALSIPVPASRRRGRAGKRIRIEGASENNLRNITVDFPLGTFICVTGVSGSGKSTLIDEILWKALRKKLYKSRERAGAHKKLLGAEQIDKVIEIDQSPIGRTPRSNPATYTGIWGPIREIFSRLPDSRMRGFKPGRFSFNVKGGRCEACEGDGVKMIEMHFLPDVFVTCEVCRGMRFNAQTLEVRYRGRNIAEVLKLSVEEAMEIFENIPAVHSKLKTLFDVGLGYVELGQSSTTLSGGEAQRVKLATELSKRATGKTLYILDEPTTGLHFEDIAKLLGVLQALVDRGNTVIVIEHNLDVIKSADHVIDLGPEGGSGGGKVVGAGTPEALAGIAASYTGQFLKKIL
ncbi:MAG: excinuclease ABC subunit UvrA [Candidatus Omnitrophica bacterium]|nr:excinuclease ABC subunit UvrA [Candidatus Omnitrophota bacterium]